MRPAIAMCLLMLPCACGPKMEGREDADATATAGEVGPMTGPTTGDTAPTGGEGGTTGEAGTGTDDTTTTVGPGTTTLGDMCDEFVDAEPAPAVTVSLRNDGATPVFLFHANFCEQVPLVDISGPNSDVPVVWTQDSCEFTCEQAIDGVCGCPPFCPVDMVLMIAPGGTHSFAWRGAVYAPAMLPLGCAQDASCGDTCLQVSQAGPGTYTLRAHAATTVINCEDPNVCTCTPNADGWCDIAASGIGAEARDAEATVLYPNETVVTLVFTDG